MSEQMSIFDFLLPRYTIQKKIRMIELFAGIGSQLKSLEVLKRYYPQIEFESEDYNSLVKCGLSDSAIYHIAGDSIVVNVLISLFNNLIEDKLDQHELVVNDYMKGNVNERY